MAITRPNTGNGHALRGPRRQPRAASDTVIKLRRTETPDEPPVGLQVGEPSVEIASTPPKLWIGVPTTINAAGRALVAGAPTLPAGGAVNEVLTKASATDRDVGWRAVGIALGSNSTAIGVDALAVNTGNFNVAYGNNALTSNTATSGNTAVGANALQACVTNWNTAVGFTSLGALASGEHNTALGFQAAQSVVDANHSTFVGFRARPAGEGQTNQLVIGYDAVGNGSHTITLGDGQVVSLHTRAGLVLDSATGGSQGLGTVNSKGLFVDGVGVTALPSGGAQYTVLTKASATDRDVEWRGPGARPGNITVLGQRTGTNVGSVNNTVIGFNAYNSAGTSGSANVAIGSNALLSGVNVNNNTAVGANALAMTQAGGNVAVGAGALQSSTAVTDSVAVGSQALSQAPNSAGDTAVGASAASFTRGVENTVVGYSALAGNPHDGDCNIAIGVWAGRYWGATLSTDHNTNSAGSIFIGCRTQPLALNQTNQIVIGHEAIGNGSHTVTLGNDDVTALYTRAGLVLNNATGGSQGRGTVNATGLFRNGVPITSGFAPSVGWTIDTDPNGISMFINNTNQVLNIVAVSGIVEEFNGATAEVTVVKAQNNQPLSAGTPVHNIPFDANEQPAGIIQDLVPNGVTLGIGERLGLQATASLGWANSVASITVYLIP